MNENTGASVQTRTNEAGMYRVNSLLPGSYRVEASLTGFETLTRKGLTLTVGQVLPVDLVLQVGRRANPSMLNRRLR